MNCHKAKLKTWRKACEDGELSSTLAFLYGKDHVKTWERRYAQVLDAYAETYGSDACVVIARCPAQINIMGMHLDYGGMPSLRMAVRGVDVITVAGVTDVQGAGTRVRLRSIGENTNGDDLFSPVEFDLCDLSIDRDIRSRSDFMNYASEVCNRRERETGRLMADDWGILPQGQLAYLSSYFRDRCALGGFDGVIWSNVPSSGGMSSSSAVVVSSAYAVMGLHGLVPGIDMPNVDVIDGIGTSEWMRGTRGGTADHGGMIMGKVGELVSVGVLPATDWGRAALPGDFVAVVFDSGVKRVYEDALRDETVISYPLGVFILREFVFPEFSRDVIQGDFASRLKLIRDVTAGNLAMAPAQIFAALKEIPRRISLNEVRDWSVRCGKLREFENFLNEEVGNRYPYVAGDYPIFLRRRFAFALAEHDRVSAMREFIERGDMQNALGLIRISHVGERDEEVSDELLSQHQARVEKGDERGRLCFLSGGYGRMTPEYDRVAVTINEYLIEKGGIEAGAVQRIGAGWGGSVGGLLRKDFTEGQSAEQFSDHIRNRLELDVDFQSCIVTPGEGASLLDLPH